MQILGAAKPVARGVNAHKPSGDTTPAARLAALGPPIDINRVREHAVSRATRGAEPASERQVKAIYAIGRAGRLSDDEIDNRCQSQFGCTPSDLQRSDASTLIDKLKEEMTSGVH